MSDNPRDNVPIRRGDIMLQKIVRSPEKPRSLDIIERIGGDIRSGSLKYFFNHILPLMKPELDVDRIYNSCITGKTLSKKRGSKEYTWKSIRKNSRGTPAHKARFVTIFRAITGIAQGSISVNTSSDMTSTYFSILDNSSELGSGNNGNYSQDSVIYLENALEGLPDTSEEERLYNTSFTFHLKSSNSKNDVYDVRFILYHIINTNLLHL